MAPLEVLELLNSSLKAPIAEAFGYQCGCRRAMALVSSYHGGRIGSVAWMNRAWPPTPFMNTPLMPSGLSDQVDPQPDRIG